MPKITSYTLKNTELIALQDKVARLDRGRVANEEDIAAYELKVRKGKLQLEFDTLLEETVRRLVSEQPPEDVLAEYLGGRLLAVQNWPMQSKIALELVQGHLLKSQDLKPKLLERLSVLLVKVESEKEKEERVVTLKALSDLLLKNPTVVPNTVKMEQISGSLRISWVFRGLVCTPDTNPYSETIDSSAFLLEDIRVSVNMDNNRVTIRNDKEAASVYGWSGFESPHPHVLENGEPCFGDFLGNIVDSIQEADFEILASSIQLYLEQAHSGDVAGGFWPSFKIKSLDFDNRFRITKHERKLRCYIYRDDTVYGLKGDSMYVTITGNEVKFVKNGVDVTDTYFD